MAVSPFSAIPAILTPSNGFIIKLLTGLMLVGGQYLRNRGSAWSGIGGQLETESATIHLLKVLVVMSLDNLAIL
jgi:hypothetical protein